MKHFGDIGRYIARTQFFLTQLIRLVWAFFLMWLRFGANFFRSNIAKDKEIALLRLELSQFKSRKVKPRRFNSLQRVLVVWLTRNIKWQNIFVIFQPETVIRWHRNAFKAYWTYKTRPGRPKIPGNIQAMIREIQKGNPLAGEQYICNTLLLKFGIKLSPRTVAKYMIKHPEGTDSKKKPPSQNWSTFIHNHADAFLATDFMTVVSWNFKIYYVLVILEIDSRKIIHTNVTQHPTALWTLQQFREAIPSDHSYKYLIHDRDCIFSTGLDQSINNMGIEVLKTPPRSPKANAFCERVIGTIRREFTDHVIPLSQKHLRRTLKEYVKHYNQTRPHSSIMSFPDPPDGLPVKPQQHRHYLPDDIKIVSTPVLGGLHTDYRLKRAA